MGAPAEIPSKMKGRKSAACTRAGRPESVARTSPGRGLPTLAKCINHPGRDARALRCLPVELPRQCSRLECMVTHRKKIQRVPCAWGRPASSVSKSAIASGVEESCREESCREESRREEQRQDEAHQIPEHSRDKYSCGRQRARLFRETYKWTLKIVNGPEACARGHEKGLKT